MDEIQDRLESALKDCKEGYSAWRANPKDVGAREKLIECAHELRRVGARLEIELAVADRNMARDTPIPIPSHRAAGRRDQVAQTAQPATVPMEDEAPALKPRRIADGLKPKRTERTLILSGKGEDGEQADVTPVVDNESVAED